MIQPLASVRPLISLTSHERLDVLVGQICNLLDSFAPGARVVVHRSANWVPLPPAEEARWEGALAELPGVLINPDRHPTRWAHMFHAHVSNLRFALAADPDWTTFVLHSSADLMVRRGVERILAAHDYGGAMGEVKPTTPWQWVPAIMEDAVLQRMAAGRPIRASMHESTFYQRRLAEEMLAEIDAHVSDWEYDDRYPKEEVFFPTLAGGRGLTVATKYAHLLRFSTTLDAAVLSMGMRLVETTTPEEGDAVARASPVWPYVPFGCQPHQLYCLGRIPRDREHPLRRAILARSGLWRDLGSQAGLSIAPVSPFRLAAEIDAWAGSAGSETVAAAVRALRDQSYFQPSPMLDPEGRWFPETGGAPENRFSFAGTELRAVNAPPHAAVVLRSEPAVMGVQTRHLALHGWRTNEAARLQFARAHEVGGGMDAVLLVVGAPAELRRSLELWIEVNGVGAFPARSRSELALGGDAVLLLWRFDDLPASSEAALVFDPGRSTEQLVFAGPVLTYG